MTAINGNLDISLKESKLHQVIRTSKEQQPTVPVPSHGLIIVAPHSIKSVSYFLKGQAFCTTIFLLRIWEHFSEGNSLSAFVGKHYKL